MTTEPDEIRTHVQRLLGELPAFTGDGADVDIDAVAARLEEAHELLVHALKSVEKGPAGGSVATSGMEG